MQERWRHELSGFIRDRSEHVTREPEGILVLYLFLNQRITKGLAAGAVRG